MRFTVGHLSLQIQLSALAFRQDCEKGAGRAVKKNYRWQTGTEANSLAAFRAIAHAYTQRGFWVSRGADMWVAIPKDHMASTPETEFIKVLDGQAGKFTDKGIFRVTYTDVALGKITILVSHYLTLRQAAAHPSVNDKIAKELGRLARLHGIGGAKVFFAGDVNENDAKFDVFDGNGFVSVGDELGQHPGTHGSRPIDVIARWKRDTKVRPVGWVVLNDRVFFLHGDHALVEATFEILEEPPAPKPPVPPKPVRRKVKRADLANPPLVGDGIPNRHSGVDNNKPILRVVVHSAVMPCKAGNARRLGAMNQTSTTGSWHYATDPKEKVQCSWDRVICWHAPPNPNTLGIEMADSPAPWPKSLTATVMRELVKRWRWNSAEHKAMLRNTAELTAELCLKHGLPLVFLSSAALKRNPDAKGITTHAQTSLAFGESSHWDPGAWPRRRFMRMVRAHAATIEVI